MATLAGEDRRRCSPLRGRPPAPRRTGGARSRSQGSTVGTVLALGERQGEDGAGTGPDDVRVGQVRPRRRGDHGALPRRRRHCAGWLRRYPGFSTPSTTTMRASALGIARSASARDGKRIRMTATRPSARSPKASLANAVSVRCDGREPRQPPRHQDRPARPGHLHPGQQRLAHERLRRSSMPAAIARRSSRAPSTMVRPVAARSRRSRSAVAALRILGLAALARHGWRMRLAGHDRRSRNAIHAPEVEARAARGDELDGATDRGAAWGGIAEGGREGLAQSGGAKGVAVGVRRQQHEAVVLEEFRAAVQEAGKRSVSSCHAEPPPAWPYDGGSRTMPA